MGELEDRVGELRGRIRRLDSAMAELERFGRAGSAGSAQLREAVRDFERDLGFVERAFARVRDAADPRRAAE